ncbi:hypothetical protein PFDG_03928 [Plasmodium falciparum Dd2]|uniref:Uncharacterized protein n=1 Tax=Plasmodium falciparum (isolate Dd2) TaxID=57267 RepID=A0A0L7M4H8_PLAF4|nr:hypothetical protein PFDG_03928 [Plasmodium falciparum Dd2]
MFHSNNSNLYKKRDMVKNVFSLFSFTSNVDDKAIKLWPLKFIEKEEESLYIIKICHNIYKKRFFSS